LRLSEPKFVSDSVEYTEYWGLNLVLQTSPQESKTDNNSNHHVNRLVQEEKGELSFKRPESGVKSNQTTTAGESGCYKTRKGGSDKKMSSKLTLDWLQSIVKASKPDGKNEEDGVRGPESGINSNQTTTAGASGLYKMASGGSGRYKRRSSNADGSGAHKKRSVGGDSTTAKDLVQGPCTNAVNFPDGAPSSTSAISSTHHHPRPR